MGRRRSSTSAAPGSRPPPSGARRDAGPRGGRPSREPRARAYVRAGSPPGSRRRRPRARSVAPVPLFLPRVAAKVVPVLLPEPGLVLGAQVEAAYPFGAFPEVKVRHEQARRPAVLRLERLLVVSERDPGLAAGDVLERQVRRVAAVAEGHHVLGLVLDTLEQRVDRDALPDRVELRPLGHAVDVLRDLLARQRAELLPRPPHRLEVGALDRERPLLERDVRRRAGGEDGEVVSQVLPGRDAVGRPVLAPPAKSARDDVHDAASPATVSGRPSASPTGASEPSSLTDQP